MKVSGGFQTGHGRTTNRTANKSFKKIYWEFNRELVIEEEVVIKVEFDIQLNSSMKFNMVSQFDLAITSNVLNCHVSGYFHLF